MVKTQKSTKQETEPQTQSKPKSILKSVEKPRPEVRPVNPQAVKILALLNRIVDLESDLEKRKVNLSRYPDFNLIDAFRILDRQGLGTISGSDLQAGLLQYGI